MYVRWGPVGTGGGNINRNIFAITTYYDDIGAPTCMQVGAPVASCNDLSYW